MLETRPVRMRLSYAQRWSHTCPPSSNTVSNIIYLGNNYRSGSALPNYRNLIAQGANATTGFSGTLFSISQSPGFISTSFRYPYGGCSNKPDYVATVEVEGDILYPTRYPQTNSSLDQSADNDASSGFIKHARSVQTQMSGLTFLGELRETLQMIRSPAKALRNGISGYLRDLKKGRRLKPSKRENFVSELWLENAFGWQPLISDTKDAAIALSRLVNDNRRREVVSGYGEASSTSNFLVQRLTLNNYCSFIQTEFTKNVTSVRYKGSVIAKATGPTLDHAMNLFGFNLSEFVPTAWELIPYSFLIDYFTNVGDIIESAFFDRSTLAWVCKTVRRTSTLTVGGKHDLDYTRSVLGPNLRSSVGSPGKIIIEKKDISRSSSGIPVPSLQFSIPGRPAKWINLAALASTHKNLTPYF